MQPRILALQFRISPHSLAQEQLCLVREAGEYSTIDFVSALDDDVDWNSPETLLEGYSGLILGGSGDLDFDGNRSEDDEVRALSWALVDRLRPLFEYVFAQDIPTLGICYGHQILGAFAGAKVHSDPLQKKTKSHEVRFVVDKSEHFMFNELPDSFYAHYGHKDVLDRVPEGAVLLMEGGEACQVSALQYKKNIYTVQFHPELTFVDMIERVQNSKGYLPEGAIAEEIFKDDPRSNAILRNFSKFVAGL